MGETLSFWATSTLLALSLVTSACSPASGEATGPVQAAALARAPDVQVNPPSASDGIRRNEVWWCRLGEQSAVTAWFGPPMLNEHGDSTRYYVISCFRPGAPSPLTVVQFQVALDGRDVIEVKRPGFLVTLQPLAGLSWRGVSATEQIEGTVEGFY